jgi:hypothetical protein
MKGTTLLIMLAMPFFCQSQKLQVDLFGGVATYQGDLQGKRYTLNQSRAAIGIGATYGLSEKFFARAGFTYGGLAGDDKLNTTGKGIEFRNLRFKSAVSEMHLVVEYNLFRLEGKSLTPYVFGGIALFHFNPYTNDSIGNKYFLKPLSTEGQGLAAYPNKKNYSLTQFAIPFGGGLKIKLSDEIQVALELGVRKTFTDFIDDVSGFYVDRTTLLNERGAKAVELSYRGNELSGAPTYPVDGTQRGNEKTKDWYYFTGVRLSKTINNKAGRIAKGRDKLGCPGKVL